jgi:hypothetical protein
MNKTYIVRLTDDEHQGLLQLTKSGTAAASKIKVEGGRLRAPHRDRLGPSDPASS